MSDAPGLPLRTGRLLLRPLEAADLDAALLVVGDPRVSRFVGDGRLWDAAYAASWLIRARAHFAAHGFGSLAVEEIATGRTVGEAGLIVLEGGPGVEVSYTRAYDAWGRGYATEAARAVLGWGFGSLGWKGSSRSSIRRTSFRGASSRSWTAPSRPLAHYGADLLKCELTAGEWREGTS